MKETKTYLTERWNTELQMLGDSITHALRNKGDLTKIKLSRTSEGLIDLRGFSAPKQYATEKSSSGRDKRYVSEGIGIKNHRFEGIDFSYSDFERCEFFDCSFNRSNFREARFVATNYSACQFHDIEFVKTNFGHSTFKADGVISEKLKENFTRILFDNVNLSEVHMNDQTFENCQFSNCKTGVMILSKCVLANIKFIGTVKNLFIKESRKVDNVDFAKAIVSGLTLEKQSLDGFDFPDGDVYFRFKNKTKELENLKLRDKTTDEENKLIDTIKSVWTRNKLETDFVDVNWLEEDELEIGKLIIKELKKGDQQHALAKLSL